MKTPGSSEGINMTSIMKSVYKNIILPFKTFVNMGYPLPNAPERVHRNYRINLLYRVFSLLVLILGTLLSIKLLFFY